ncbi:MAG: BON domain-containing protein [Byssovorax sp.]
MGNETNIELNHAPDSALPRRAEIDADRPFATTDRHIAVAARDAVRRDIWVPKVVAVTVDQGRITLEGKVEWDFQRESAERAVKDLAGVVSVNNAISVVTGAFPTR